MIAPGVPRQHFQVALAGVLMGLDRYKNEYVRDKTFT
jgi:hypothetical protein